MYIYMFTMYSELNIFCGLHGNSYKLLSTGFNVYNYILLRHSGGVGIGRSINGHSVQKNVQSSYRLAGKFRKNVKLLITVV